MIYVLNSEEIGYGSPNLYAGEWYYYYGNGEYGITPVKGDGDVYNTDYQPNDPVVYSIGDVNLDGNVNITDATLIQKHGVKKHNFSSKELSLADVNNDGKVNVTDATLIQKYIVGKATL